MAHCFNINPVVTIKKEGASPDLLYYDQLSLLLASITKQLITATSGDIIDIGAYNGTWSDYVNNNCPDITRRIILFEPAPVEYTYLRYKYKDYKRYSIHNLAIAAIRGTIHLTDVGPNSNCLTEVGIEIPATTYDSLYSSRPMSIVKFRVNGYETNVLYGMQASINKGMIKALIFDFCPSSGGYHKGELRIEKHLINLIEQFKYVYVIVREYMCTIDIRQLSSFMDIMDFFSTADLNDTYDCICTNCNLRVSTPEQN